MNDYIWVAQGSSMNKYIYRYAYIVYSIPYTNTYYIYM